MSEGPLICPMEDKDNQNEAKFSKWLYISNINDTLFQFDFIKEKNYIEIESYDTMPEEKIIFTKKIFSEEFQQSLKKFDFSKDLSFTYDLIRKMKEENNFKIEKKDNKILMEILFEYMNKSETMKIILEEKRRNEICNKIVKKNDISNFELEKVIQELKDENISLKEMLKEAFEEINMLKNQFSDYIKKTELNNFYNSYDDTLYLLDEVYKSISKDIIENRDEFALINSGIKHLFKKGINFFNFSQIFFNYIKLII